MLRIIILSSLILYSCATVGEKYNTPFINSSETSKLDFDMTKEEVLTALGEPLIVKSGTGSTRTIVWIYEVRTIAVEGDKIATKPGVEEYSPKKTSNLFKHADFTHHTLALEFIDGKLINWGPENCIFGLCDEVYSANNTNNQKKKKKKKNNLITIRIIDAYYQLI